MGFGKAGIVGVCWLACAAAAMPAAATPTNFVVNGGFEQTTIASGAPLYGSYQMNTTNVVGWSSGTVAGNYTDGYNFLYASSPTSSSGTTADTTGAFTPEYNQYLQLWGPNDGSTNGLTTSPNGGNFVGADGAYQTGAITQTITGLAVGSTYVLTFNWAGAQQQGFRGVNSEGWLVAFGADNYDTGYIQNTDMGFTGWKTAAVMFTAKQSNQVLSFLAKGLPAGVPPFSLLDGVSIVVPEPSTWVLMMGGVVGLAGMLRLRRRVTAG